MSRSSPRGRRVSTSPSPATTAQTAASMRPSMVTVRSGPTSAQVQTPPSPSRFRPTANWSRQAGAIQVGAGGIDFALSRYNSNGSLDTGFDGDGLVTASFSPEAEERALGMAVQGDGKILAGGFAGPAPLGSARLICSRTIRARWLSRRQLRNRGQGRLRFRFQVAGSRPDADDRWGRRPRRKQVQRSR